MFFAEDGRPGVAAKDIKFAARFKFEKLQNFVEDHKRKSVESYHSLMRWILIILYVDNF